MFLRAKLRKKEGKQHRYFSVVENRRVGRSKTAQRTVLYLGEINDSQETAWRNTLEVVDESRQQYSTLRLFPEDRQIAAEAANTVQVKLREMELRRPRAFGSCWLGCELWRQLQLEAFWQEKLLQVQRETVPWEKVLQLLVVNRLLEPGSEFRLHRHWFDQSAMAELLDADFAVAEKDRLYRCLDRILQHKSALFAHLRQRWQDLFAARFDVLLYDLTSTYIEGEGEQIPKAKYGYSRDQRFDCKQVVIALVITPEGFPLAYEVMDGNTSDRTTLRGFLEKIESSYGKAHRIWVMDRGIPTEATLAHMRQAEQKISYLVGTPRSKIRQYEKKWLELPWQKVRDAVEVKLFAEEGELYVLAKSEGRRAKERAMRRKKLVRLLRKLRAMRRSCPRRDQLLLRIGAARKEAGSVSRFIEIQVPREGEAVTRASFRFRVDKAKLEAAELQDGHYLLRSNLVNEDPAALWERYIQLTQIEAAFKALKSEMGLRPIYHQLAHRVEAHIFIAFLAYCLLITLKARLQSLAPGLTPKAVLEKLASIQMLNVCLPTTDGRLLVMPRYTQPEPDQAILLHKLQLSLPQQPPPRIKAKSNEFPREALRM